MPEQIATYAQIASIVVYVFSVFGLYILLTKQKDATIENLNTRSASIEREKDATIETLKTRIELLTHQLELAQENTPEVAVEAYANRVKRVTEELARLREDNDVSVEIINAKVLELETANSNLVDLRKQLIRAEARLAEFYCPLCTAPIETKDTDMRGEVINGEPVLEFYDVTYFVCGCEVVNGQVTRKCDEPD